MKDWRSQSHVKWDCKYHVVIVPKYRRKRFYGSARSRVGEILRQLCRQKDVELLEGKAQADHIHMLLSVPPKYSIAMTIGYLKGKSAVRIHRELMKTHCARTEDQLGTAGFRPPFQSKHVVLKRRGLRPFGSRPFFS